MANSKQASAKRLKMHERAQQQMDIHFPNFAPAWIWRRSTNDGYSTIPRSLPIAMQAIDAQSKGQPAGHTLFCLWARSPDHPVVTIDSPAIFASEAGFMGERAVDTWRKRMKKLRELCFIQTKPGASGEFHYVLLTNPNAAVEAMRIGNLVRDELYSRFVDRLADIGAHGDLQLLRELWASDAARRAAEEAVKAQTIPDVASAATSA